MLLVYSVLRSCDSWIKDSIEFFKIVFKLPDVCLLSRDVNAIWDF